MRFACEAHIQGETGPFVRVPLNTVHLLDAERHGLNLNLNNSFKDDEQDRRVRPSIKHTLLLRRYDMVCSSSPLCLSIVSTGVEIL